MSPKNQRISGRDFLYNQILDKIQYCEWEPGSPINETMICETYGVSKTPVREALMLLSKEHFVDVYPQSGSYVSKIDIKRISDILFLRNSVEKTVMLELAKKKAKITPSIEKSFVLMEYAIRDENWRECLDLDYGFHKELFLLANRPNSWEIIEKYLPHWTRFRFFDSVILEEYKKVPGTLDEHRQIARCIEEGNTGQLRKVLDDHLDPKYKKVYKRFMLQKNYKYLENTDAFLE